MKIIYPSQCNKKKKEAKKTEAASRNNKENVRGTGPEIASLHRESQLVHTTVELEPSGLLPYIHAFHTWWFDRKRGGLHVGSHVASRVRYTRRER